MGLAVLSGSGSVIFSVIFPSPALSRHQSTRYKTKSGGLLIRRWCARYGPTRGARASEHQKVNRHSRSKSHSTHQRRRSNSRNRHLASGNEQSRLHRFDLALERWHCLFSSGAAPNARHYAPAHPCCNWRRVHSRYRSLLELMLAIVSDRPNNRHWLILPHCGRLRLLCAEVAWLAPESRIEFALAEP